ncbi:uncharacterized protein LOC135222743 isoform X2 [Macrobrachium nipponense]|uniref:uncharacterized protein LOC135222743 isoform X2 n=1 Tax=Macrobrachium nipponense TaxID=159736 RepID=UPI0030C8043E
MCNNKEKKESEGGGRPSSTSSTQSVCSQPCAEKYNRLAKDLGETKDKLLSLALQVEEQASHIAKLTEENKRYILENGRMKKKNSHRSPLGAAMNDASSYGHVFPADTTELEDKIMALQLQNSELNVCLEREKRLRKEAESRLHRDMGYIKRLEDSVQTLRGTRVIMDPSTYRQVAEAYMAAKRTPTRRPHTHNGVPGSDLVCDATRNNVSDSRQRFSHPALHHTSSCPSANSVTAPTSNSVYSSIEYPEVTNAPNKPNKTKRERGVAPNQDLDRGYGVGTNTMNPWDYQQLLESLEDLEGSSRGALS